MMKTMDIVLNKPGATAATYQLGFKDPCRVIGAYVTLSDKQTSGADFSLGKNGADSTILSKDMDDVEAATTTKLDWTASLTEVNRKQIFDRDTPLEFKFDLAIDSTIHLQLILDPFLIGAHEGLSS